MRKIAIALIATVASIIPTAAFANTSFDHGDADRRPVVTIADSPTHRAIGDSDDRKHSSEESDHRKPVPTVTATVVVTTRATVTATPTPTQNTGAPSVPCKSVIKQPVTDIFQISHCFSIVRLRTVFVSTGDSWYTVANKYNMTLQALRYTNGPSLWALRPGQMVWVGTIVSP